MLSNYVGSHCLVDTEEVFRMLMYLNMDSDNRLRQENKMIFLIKLHISCSHLMFSVTEKTK